MSSPKRCFKDLLAWQKAMDLIPEIYAIVKQFPSEERYALGDQIRRAVVSVPANIAEGQSRRHKKEFIQFLSIAKGSLAELETLLIAAQMVGFLPQSLLDEIESKMSEIGRLLNGLINSLTKT